MVLSTPPAKMGRVPNRLPIRATRMSSGTSLPEWDNHVVNRQRGRLNDAACVFIDFYECGIAAMRRCPGFPACGGDPVCKQARPNRARIAPDYAAKDPARGSLEAALDMMSQSYVLRYYERMGRALESLIGDLGFMAGYT